MMIHRFVLPLLTTGFLCFSSSAEDIVQRDYSASTLEVGLGNNVNISFRRIEPGNFMMGSQDHYVEGALAALGVTLSFLFAVVFAFRVIKRRKVQFSLQGLILGVIFLNIGIVSLFKLHQLLHSLRGADEADMHPVSITKPFYIGVYEVTREQYFHITGKMPRGCLLVGFEKHPIVNVSWHDAVEFCTKVSVLSKTNCRLPTEAEWEFASSCDSALSPSQINLVSWNNSNSGYDGRGQPTGLTKDLRNGSPRVVGLKNKNCNGLYDTLGNAAEWVSDSYFEDIKDTMVAGLKDVKIAKGGSWAAYTRECRPSARKLLSPADMLIILGFRVMLEIPEGVPMDREGLKAGR